MTQTEDRCPYYSISREQRERELEQGLSEKGTLGYERHGCYECSGVDIGCRIYQEYISEDK